MPAKGFIDPTIRDLHGNIIPWRERNKDRANARQRHRAAVRKELNPEKERLNRRKWTIKSKFGLTPELREKLIKLQGNKCAICNQFIEDTNDSNWAIDHCHVGDFVRGMLCKTCNSGLGFFKDNSAILRRAAQYIDECSKIGSIEPTTEDFIIATRLLESI